MKKIFTYLAIASLAFVACQKESAIEKENTPAIINGNIPTEIVCEIGEAPTKTQYAGNTTFGWTKNDVARMPVKDGSNQWNYFSFTTTDDSGTPSATFIRNNSGTPGDDMETYSPSSTWTNSGYLLYPSSVFDFTGSQADGVWNSGDFPIVNLPAAIAYNSTNPLDGGVVPLIGRKVGGTYKFATAVGFLKVTVSNIPANLATVKLVSTTNCISGKFAVSHSTTNYLGSDVAIAQVATSATGHNSEGTKELTLNVSSLTEGETYNFYFPIPVGTYDASTLSIKLGTQNGETVKVISKIIAKDITIARNEVLSIPELAMVYPRNVSISFGSTCCPQIDYTLSEKVLRFNVSKSANEDLSSYIEGNKFTSGTAYTMAQTFSPYSAKVTALSDGGADKYYLHYIFVNADTALTTLGLSDVNDVRILEYGTIPFYYLSPEASSIVGTYYINNNSTFAVTIHASDDPEKGNVKITHFTGSYNVDMETYGNYDPFNGKVTFNAATSTDTSKSTYAFVLENTLSSTMEGVFSTHDRFAFTGKFGLYQYISESWTDKNYAFTSPTLYKQ